MRLRAVRPPPTPDSARSLSQAPANTKGGQVLSPKRDSSQWQKGRQGGWALDRVTASPASGHLTSPGLHRPCLDRRELGPAGLSPAPSVVWGCRQREQQLQCEDFQFHQARGGPSRLSLQRSAGGRLQCNTIASSVEGAPGNPRALVWRCLQRAAQSHRR